ncbi:GPW/gp25 family protein [uncultured Desulfuromusa sp.]|uniref:GPW/gp25 family protein n=1 Tax=uncultured Desulfuromusa sp. TaxID=219183 RepID=UPI002AA8D670|nr:GPW/gp25 family protein [uncultured Desulfuromusa sp.]
MNGSSVDTGKPLSGLDHLRQSIIDILTTPIGSRVMRRNYGSRLFELLDRPVTGEWLIDCYAWSAEALDQSEPRFSLDQIEHLTDEDGQQTLGVQGEYLPDGQAIKLEGIVL